jgi:hypothetical protein
MNNATTGEEIQNIMILRQSESLATPKAYKAPQQSILAFQVMKTPRKSITHSITDDSPAGRELAADLDDQSPPVERDLDPSPLTTHQSGAKPFTQMLITQFLKRKPNGGEIHHKKIRNIDRKNSQ